MPHYYGQFALFLGRETPSIFSKFNPLNMDTFSKASLSVQVLTWFDCNHKMFPLLILQMPHLMLQVIVHFYM